MDTWVHSKQNKWVLYTCIRLPSPDHSLMGNWYNGLNFPSVWSEANSWDHQDYLCLLSSGVWWELFNEKHFWVSIEYMICHRFKNRVRDVLPEWLQGRYDWLQLENKPHTKLSIIRNLIEKETLFIGHNYIWDSHTCSIYRILCPLKNDRSDIDSIYIYIFFPGRI